MSRGFYGGERGKSVRACWWGEELWNASFWTAIAVAHTNSQQLQLPAQGLYKMNPVKLPAWLREEPLRPQVQLQLRSYWQLMVSEEGLLLSFGDITVGRLIVIHPCACGQHYLDSGVTNNKNLKRHEAGGRFRDTGGNWREVVVDKDDQCSFYKFRNLQKYKIIINDVLLSIPARSSSG